MPSYVTPKRATEYILYVSLISQANTKIFQANPTLAAGDVKVSIDGGALANLATLPAVTPAGGKGVKVTLSIAEMTGDNIHVAFVDAAGAEWCDLFVSLQTSLRQVDDISTQTSVNTIDGIVDDILLDTVEIGTAGAGLTNINLPNQTMDIIGNITGNLSGSVGSVTGLTAATVHGDLDDLQARLPAALTADGNMKADSLRLNGSALAAQLLAASALGIYSGSITGATPTTTTLVDSALGSLATDFWKNAVILFISGAQAKQRAQVTEYNGGTNTLTFSTLSGAPAQTDLYVLL